MRKLFVFVAILITATLGTLLISCSEKDNLVLNDESIPKDLLEEAKNWHYQHTSLLGQKDIVSGKSSNKKRLILTPKFKEARLITFPGASMLYTPAMEFDLKNNKTAMLRGFVFLIKENKIESCRIVEIYATPDYISSTKNELLSKFVAGRLNNFTGSIITYDVNYNYIEGQVFINGHRTSGRPKLGYKAMDENHMLSLKSKMGELWYVFLVTYYSDGSSTWEYLYSYYEDDGSNNGENPGGGSGEPGGSGTTTTSSIPGDTYELQTFEQDYRNRMAPSELLIFDNMNRFQQVAYLLNAQNALALASLLYPGDQTNTKADAFRHAFFSYLNVVDLGYSLAESLGTAHETMPGQDPTQASMDLHNNQEGRDAFYEFTYLGDQTIDEYLQEKMDSGEMRIICDGILVPSNYTCN